MARKRFGNLATHAHETLRQWILDGTLLPGTRLSVREIASQLEVSNGPVRDALIELRSQGLVQGGHGPEWAVSSVTPEKLDDMIVVREALEVQSVRQCALAARPNEIQKLRMMAAEIDRRVEMGMEDDELTLEMDGRFHGTLAEIAGSQALRDEIERWRVVMTWVGMYMRKHTRRAQSHLKVVEAIATGDPQVAEEEMREHIRHPWEETKPLVQSLNPDVPDKSSPRRKGRPTLTSNPTPST